MDARATAPEKRALITAADKCGGQTGLADRLTELLGKRVSQQWVWNVINRDQPVPPEWCLPIEAATAGHVTRHQLRPDLYPHEAAA